jgi:predicted acyltransferase
MARRDQQADSVARFQAQFDPHRYRIACERLTDLRTGFAYLALRGRNQRIGICYFVAAILELWVGRRGQLLAFLKCLLGYWVLLRFVPVPGAGVPGRDIPFMDQVQNLPTWLDRKLFMGHLYDGTRDPEGISHTIPAIGTTLIGVLTGHWLKSKRRASQLIGAMVFFGILGMLSGRALESLVSDQQEFVD